MQKFSKKKIIPSLGVRISLLKFFFLTLLATNLSGTEHYREKKAVPSTPIDERHSPISRNRQKKYNDSFLSYKRPDHIPIEVWEQVESKLLPIDHPIKRKLDKIFSIPGVNKNAKSLISAGFRFPPIRTKLNAVVAKHPKLKGFRIKTFTDEQPYPNEWTNWLNRIRGAELIAEMIESRGYHSTFKTPQKWMYLIPNQKENSTGRSFLLVVEDMKLNDNEANKKSWRKNVSVETLDALHDLIETLGLIDSVYIDNIPFSIDGKIAFIDTEHFLKWPVPYYKLNKRLSNKNRSYWTSLTQ